jgi:hypothetical protein
VSVVALRTIVDGRPHWYVDTIHPMKVQERYIQLRHALPEQQPELVEVDLRALGSPDAV